MNSNPIVRALDTAVTNAGASTVWTDPQGSAPTSPADIALGKLAESYGAAGWVDPGGAVPTGYAERAAAHFAGGYAAGTWTDPNGSIPQGLFDRALSTVAAAIGSDGYIDEGGSIPNSFRQRVLEQIAEGLAELLNLTPANVSTLSPTFTRASAAYETDSVGVLASRAVDVLRSSHYVSAERTILLEAQRTNGWTYSEQIDNAAWVKTDASVSIDATTAPDATITADKLIESATTNVHRISRSAPATTDNATSTVSFYARPAERSWVSILTTDKAGAGGASFINLSTGATGTTFAGHTIRVSGTFNGFYRISCTFNVGTGASAPTAYVEIATGDGGRSYTGDGTSGIYLWGLQFEADQSFPSSYIKTEAATASRAVDSLSVPFTAAPQEMTVYCRFREQGTLAAGASLGLLAVGSLTNSTPRIAVFESGGVYYVSHHNGVSQVASAMSVAPTIGQLVEIRITLGADGAIQIHQSIDGGAEASGGASGPLALAGAWQSENILLNAYNASSVGFNAFRNPALILPGIKTMAECRARVGA